MPRSATEIGPGDYVKIGREWKQVLTNTAFNQDQTPRDWAVRTVDGSSYDMWGINAYAKSGDPEVRRID